MTPEALQAQIQALEATDLLTLVGHREAVVTGTTLEEVYRRFKEHAHEFVGVTDAAGRFVGVASRGKVGFVLGSRYGFSLFNRDPVEDYLLPRQLAVGSATPLLAALGQALTREGEEFHHDAALVDADGRYRGMVTVRTLVRLQSRLSALQAELAESQSQSLLEKAALRQSEERLRLALEAGQMSAWQFDVASGQIIWSQWRDGAGSSPDALPATLAAFERGVHPDDLAGTRAALRACGASGQPFTHCYRYQPMGGGAALSWRWIESRGHAARSQGGQVTTITGLSIDVTERRDAEAALQAAKAEAERANAAKSEFLSRMSHELRTPLNAILGFAQLLELEPFAPREAQSVGYILKGGRHLLGLIDEVLDITRIESGTLELSPEATDAAELLEEVIALVRPLALPRGITFHRLQRSGAGGVACRVLADRQRLRQVLLNLLSNAVKYNADRGEVHFTCEAGGTPGRVRLGVRDTGPGIAPELLPRLFTPFDRLGAEARAIEGTGIGLTISKRLAEAMGGTLTAASMAGQGSTFTVELPAAPAGPEEAPGSAEGQTPASLAAVSEPEAALTTVLQIEDNPANLSLVEKIFAKQQAGVRLLSAAQGGLGIDLACQYRPGLILLDLHLPDLPGEEVLRRLRGDARTREIPVVVLSADATARQRQRLIELGARDYLTKPLDLGVFLQTVDKVLAEL